MSIPHDVPRTWDPAASLCLIPARGGSAGVPGKNLRPLGGIPLLAHSIHSAGASGAFDEVYVSTDCPKIAATATAYGASVIPRPARLAMNDTPMSDVVEHALEWYKRERAMSPQSLVLLQPTSPLRSASDIQQAITLLCSGECDSAMGVFEADDPPQWGLRASVEGLLRPVADWDQYLSRRQDLPPAYFDGPVYAIDTDAFLEKRCFLTDRTRFFVVPRLRAVDIDTEFDLQFAEFLLQHSGELGPTP